MGSGTLAIYGRSRKAPICQFGEGIDEAHTEARNATADAAFIVSACNAHGSLVAALRDIVDYAERFAEVNDEPRGGACRASIAAARATLAKVEGT